MADESNSASNTDQPSDNGQADVNGDAGSSAHDQQSISPEEQARRDAQSKRDKAVHQTDEDQERLDYLMGREAVRERDEYINSFLSENKSKYPNVNPDLLKYASSKEEVEELAKKLQDDYKKMQQDALVSVQDGGDEPLTDEQLAKLEGDLEKDTTEHGRSNFGSFMNAITRKRG